MNGLNPKHIDLRMSDVKTRSTIYGLKGSIGTLSFEVFHGHTGEGTPQSGVESLLSGKGGPSPKHSMYAIYAYIDP